MICEFDAGWKCVRCGKIISTTIPQHLRIRRCLVDARVSKPCPHFLGGCDPPQEVLVFDCGCPSSSKYGKPVTVCECDLHGRCITFRGGELRDATVTRCRDCPDNPANYQRIEQGD